MDMSDRVRGDVNYLLMSSPRRVFQGPLDSNLEMPGNRDEENLEGARRTPESSRREMSNHREEISRTPLEGNRIGHSGGEKDASGKLPEII